MRLRCLIVACLADGIYTEGFTNCRRFEGGLRSRHLANEVTKLLKFTDVHLHCENEDDEDNPGWAIFGAESMGLARLALLLRGIFLTPSACFQERNLLPKHTTKSRTSGYRLHPSCSSLRCTPCRK